MSADKYLSIFSRQMEAIVYLSFTLSVFKFFMIVDDSFARLTTRMIVDDSSSVSCFIHQRSQD